MRIFVESDVVGGVGNVVESANRTREPTAIYR